jgi:ATP-dependent DNA ligase
MNEFESGVTEEMARALAAAAAADTDVIIVDGEIYEISEDEARADFGEYMMHNGQPGDTFADWVKENVPTLHAG